MIFKKKHSSHKLFGKLVLNGGTWEGEIGFPPQNGENVSVYLKLIGSEYDEYYLRIPAEHEHPF